MLAILGYRHIPITVINLYLKTMENSAKGHFKYGSLLFTRNKVVSPRKIPVPPITNIDLICFTRFTRDKSDDIDWSINLISPMVRKNDQKISKCKRCIYSPWGNYGRRCSWPSSLNGAISDSQRSFRLKWCDPRGCLSGLDPSFTQKQFYVFRCICRRI